ncbi:MAG: ATP-binding protein [Hydrogenovibrio sp.]|uniref:ATP-binding protein n=1 Tax=Hydrogenovibrio sp. TaxID=2065821 RepID=UPI0028707813|nr:ATP-binding protein [Hydrogenovibrio sp.]MDR9497870.1 ATP-binding protein [Hydrogenovibrio sp.]
MLNENTAEPLLEQLRELDEHPRLEAKSGSQIGASVMQTVCAFANEPGLVGGYIMLGVEEPDALHETFWVSGVKESDKLLNQLQINCREQFEQPISVKAEVANLEGQRVILIYVPELESAAKPCTFKGKFDSKNKRKTGVWRRGLNGDYECSQQELAPLLLAKNGTSYEQVVLDDAEMDDLDPSVIELYRTLRAKVSPQAEELLADDLELLRALNLVKKQTGEFKPTIAGLLLFGKPLALRRLLPAVRVDYIRVHGTQWVETPEQRFAYTQDFRLPMISLIPKLEATILDDMPRYFRLNEGETQRTDEPFLPQRVVREAVVNALMHRDYFVNQPTLVVRFSNRLEIRNAGYSLKPENQLGEMGSKLRNPILASVLYDLSFAETKGSGIRTMRRLLHEAGLSAPVFVNHQIENQFTSIYLLHQLMGEEQINWLKQFSHFALSDDEAKALMLAKETGAVDNAALRAITDLDTLAASRVLTRLTHQRGLLKQGGAGASTYYQLVALPKMPLFTESKASDLGTDRTDLGSDRTDLGSDRTDLGSDRTDLGSDRIERYAEINKKIANLSARPRKEVLWPIIVELCLIEPQTIQGLAKRLNRDITSIKQSYINPLRKQGWLDYIYPDVVNHPEQAYMTTEAGKAWLIQQDIEV